MNRTINFLTGIVAGLAPLAIAGLLGVLVYNELTNSAGIFINVLLVLLAVWLGFEIFQKVQRVGIVDFMSVVTASPDLDNLKPTVGSRTRQLTPGQLASLVQKDRHICRGGTLKVFGDWHGRPYRNFLEIRKIAFDKRQKQMVINFSKDSKLIIDEPDHILESPKVLKILSAKAVRIEFWNKKEQAPVERSYFKNYQVSDNSLETATNIDWTDQKMDAAIGQDALIIFS